MLKRLSLAVIISGLWGVNNANAQVGQDASSVNMGPFDLVPKVTTGLEYNDNLIRSASGSVDSWSFFVAPELGMYTSLGASDFSVRYRLSDKNHFSSSEDDYTDHLLVANVDIDLNARNRIRSGVRFEDGHDARGTGFSIGSGDTLVEPDQYKRSSVDFLYSYGASGADGRLNVDFKVDNLDYDIATFQYLARDRKRTTLGGTFFYRVGPATDLTFDARRSYIDYKVALNPANPFDSKQDEFLVGLSWEATSQTSGFAKIGYQTKSFDSNERDDFNGVDWEIGMIWEPVSYSEFTFKTESQTNETNGEGDFIQADLYEFAWEHEWLARLSSNVRLNFRNDTYEGVALLGQELRSDDNFEGAVSVNYDFRRWVKFQVTYQYTERDSNRSFVNFDQNLFMFNAYLSL
ncbi:outer membrane beta-barrel protein [Agaribacter marinus]|uniref:Beta-barrel porin 2 n=1 Tax=Agaribacter marinus TaxID=1431249 RepID=A0AA37T2P5_9ALTE|nr:outer membrane beta-barrel protein [Agaribacter marinus]GLR72869.1 hypothetical protein GCM10007852_37770 [Agaribacter marinus]